MNVVLCSTDYLPNIGGVAAHVHELARALRQAGHQVCVVTVRPGSWTRPSTIFSRKYDNDGVPVVELPLAGTLGGRGAFWRLRRFAERLLPTCGFAGQRAVIHVHDCDYGHYIAQHVRGDICRVFTNHTSGFLQDLERDPSSNHWRHLMAGFDWVIAPSEELAHGAVRCGKPRQQVTFIPNGVDALRFRPDPTLRRETRDELGVGPNEVVVLCARRFVPKNGVIDFAHGLRSLAAHVATTTLVFAGDSYGEVDMYEKEAIGAVKKSPFASKARFLGPVPNSHMHRLYAAADVSVLPSLKEATSIAGLEAMACGVPLVGTRVGGIPDLIDDGVTGKLVDHGNPQAFAAALAELIVDPALRRTMGGAARAKVVDSLTWSHAAARTAVIYEQAAGSCCLTQDKSPALVGV